jgi:transposase
VAPSYPAQGQEVVAADIVHPRVVLACAGESGTVPLRLVAAGTGVSGESVRKWRVRFMEHRLDGLADAVRPGALRKITDERVEVLVTRTLAEKGRGQDTRWSTRSMAAETGLSPSAVSLDLARLRRQAHLAGTGKLGTGPGFIARVRDVAGLDVAPPGHALVLAAGEKSQIRRWTAPPRACRSCPRRRGAAPATTSGTAPPACSPPASWPPARSSPGTAAAAGPGVPALPQAHRLSRPQGPGPAPGPGQRRQPQDPPPSGNGGSSTPLPPAPHPGQLLLAQPRRALVRPAGQPQVAPLSPPQRHRTRGRHPRAD